LKSDILISVIIPTLNEEKLLEQSLLQFTDEIRKKFRIELIVSDGGSKDSTLRIAEKLADIVVKAEPDVRQNIARGRNLGAKKANGSFYYFFNADTLIRNIEEYFELTQKAFHSNRVAALTCKVKVFPSEEKPADKMFHFTYNNYVSLLNSVGMGMGRGECHMVRRELFHRVQGYNESMAAGEDYDLYRRLNRLGKIEFLRKLIVYESPRRYRRYGYTSVFWDWTRNSFSVFFKNKAISKEWEPVR